MTVRTRGFGGGGSDLSGVPVVTTAATAALDAEVVLGSGVIMSGLFAARPAAGTAGRLYFATDTLGGTLYRDSGSAWAMIARGLTETLLLTGGTLSGALTLPAGSAASPALVVGTTAGIFNPSSSRVSVAVDVSGTMTERIRVTPSQIQAFGGTQPLPAFAGNSDPGTGFQPGFGVAYLSVTGAAYLTLGSSVIDANSHRITNVTDPTSAQDAATKAYVDGIANGLDWKASVRAATTANITLSGAQTIDGVSVIAGDRVLVKNQSTGSENGIYVAASGAWSRATDADVTAEVTSGLFCVVTDGTSNGDSSWVLTTNDPITLGTTSLTFAQFSFRAHALTHKSGGSDEIKLHELGVPTSAVPMNSQKITGLAAGTANGDAVRWEQSAAGIVTTKGDLIAATAANTVDRVAVGSNGTTPVADSAATAGLRYAPPVLHGRAASKYYPTGLSGGNLAPVKDRMYLVPWSTSRGETVTRLGFHLSAVGDASSVVRLGIYAIGADGEPTGPAILDAGTLAADSSAVYKELTVSQALDPGHYAIAFAWQDGTVGSGTVFANSSVGLSHGGLAALIGNTASSLSLTTACWYQSGVTGALPAISLTGVADLGPRINVKV